MKKMFLLAISLLSLSGFTQTTDSVAIEVTYPKTLLNNTHLLVINGRPLPHFHIAMLDIKFIRSFNVSRNDTTVNGHTYKSSILIGTKGEYNPTYMTLNDVKRKYTSLEDGPTVFMIDGNIVNNNYEETIVDESYILKIEVSKIPGPKKNADVNLIRLLTRSEGNIKKPKEEEFMIRGNGNMQPAANYFDNGLEQHSKQPQVN